MSRVREHRPSSFQEYVALIEKLQSTATKSLWYRGCGKASYTLVPTLYRHRALKRSDDFARIEEQLMIRFRQRSLPLVTRPLGDDWDALFFMQHYSVPTRLLDWTENPFIGFYFSVMTGAFTSRLADRMSSARALTFKSDAAIWVLDPMVWNSHALRHQSFTRGVLSTTDEAMAPYRPPARLSEAPVLPVAIHGAHNSPRIVAQRGAFTIFGHTRDPMETVFDSDGFPKGALTKIVLAKELLPTMRRSILNHGISESVVFPDLGGLAQEMSREFDFED